MTVSRISHTNHSENTAENLRLAMRRMAATVCVVSSIDRSGQACAMTATAVTSLSLDPPTMLVCVNHRAALHATIAAGNEFCINLLGQMQQPLAEQYSRAPLASHNFTQKPWQCNGQRVPYLPDAQASIFCILQQVVDHTTHSIFIGLVRDVLYGTSQSPLIYLDGSYQQYLPAVIAKEAK